MRTEEEILAEIEQAQKEFRRAESAFTHSIGGQFDPVQEVADNPSVEMIEAQETIENSRMLLEKLRDEYDFYLEPARFAGAISPTGLSRLRRCTGGTCHRC